MHGAAKVRFPPFTPWHSTNTVAANYGSGYALEVMREHLEKVWQ